MRILKDNGFTLSVCFRRSVENILQPSLGDDYVMRHTFVVRRKPRTVHALLKVAHNGSRCEKG